jgi:hypothetical protein
VSRALLVAAVAVTVGVAGSGCSSAPPARSIPVTIKGNSAAIVSDVHCVSDNGSVTVTGTVSMHAAERLLPEEPGCTTQNSSSKPDRWPGES